MTRVWQDSAAAAGRNRPDCARFNVIECDGTLTHRAKSVEERLANTDKVFKQIKDKETREKQAKKERLRQAREKAAIEATAAKNTRRP